MKVNSKTSKHNHHVRHNDYIPMEIQHDGTIILLDRLGIKIIEKTKENAIILHQFPFQQYRKAIVAFVNKYAENDILRNNTNIWEIIDLCGVDTVKKAKELLRK